MRAVLVGCGGMAHVWIPHVLAQGVEIIGLVDLDTERASQVGDKFRLECPTISELDEVLQESIPDVVLDLVTPAARFDIASRALIAGCHVLSEKPLAGTLDEATELVAIAARSGKVHAVIQNRRYLEYVRRITRFLKSGALGSIDSIHCDFFIGAHFGGFRDEMEHVLLLDMAVHTFDMARVMGGIDPVAVWAREWNPKSSWYHHGSSAVAVFDLPSGGCFTYRGSWSAEGCATPWEASWKFVGSKGSLTWDGETSVVIERVCGSEGFIRPVESVELPELHPDDRIGGHEGVIREFFEAIQKGFEPETSSRNNLTTMKMVFGAIRSAETGTRVEL